MAVGTEPQEHQIDARLADQRPEQPLVSLGCRFRRGLTRDPMDLGRWNRHPVEQDLPHHAIVAVGVVGGDTPLVSPH